MTEVIAYTAEEDQFIRESWNRLTTKEIERHLGRWSVDSINRHARIVLKLMSRSEQKKLAREMKKLEAIYCIQPVSIRAKQSAKLEPISLFDEPDFIKPPSLERLMGRR